MRNGLHVRSNHCETMNFARHQLIEKAKTNRRKFVWCLVFIVARIRPRNLQGLSRVEHVFGTSTPADPIWSLENFTWNLHLEPVSLSNLRCEAGHTLRSGPLSWTLPARLPRAGATRPASTHAKGFWEVFLGVGWFFRGFQGVKLLYYEVLEVLMGGFGRVQGETGSETTRKPWPAQKPSSWRKNDDQW